MAIQRQEDEQKVIMEFANTPPEEVIEGEYMEDEGQHTEDAEEGTGWVAQTSEPWQEEGNEPLLKNGFESWTQLYPTCASTAAEHLWNLVGWTAKYFAESRHSTICTECNRWLEEWTVESWDSGD